ncbi:polypeptide N-acetylgalactosaminyltransferase 5-like [Haliotis cracherodii]|uniref:polypeptide N-acetylgalactosaminyltransferase 5-like n=1 Tax=Haliotis cracherodii TaxID=6455 RepID=UPI0039E74B25
MYVVATNRRNGVPPEIEIEQWGQQAHDHDTHIVEYYVEEQGGEDSNVTYPPFVEHSPENGPGEWGTAFNYKPTGAEKLQYEEGKMRNGFNQLVSDRISIHRRLLDNRVEECKSRVYPADLPQASVIICFHNEAWSTLLRSVHSVLDRSPEHLIREIILVDDASTQDHLKTPLKKYMSKLGKVKIVRHKDHQGLIRARLSGYEVASGPVLVFLDSHIECFPGWLEPLLNRIKENPRNVLFPQIDVISSDNFGTGISQMLEQFGVFRWRMLHFNWGSINDERKSKLKTPADPVRSPTMPGGLFAIDKQWFTTLGTYDPGLLYWGGENMELSFKIWMCNGTLEILPCSHVGHVFRMRNPVRWEGKEKPILTNSMRVAEVWLDEYKYLFYEQTSLMPVRNYDSPTMCLSAARNRIPRLCSCLDADSNKIWQLLPSGVLQDSNAQRLCVKEGELIHDECYTTVLFSWTYTEDDTLYLKTYDKCLTVGENSSLHMATCDGNWNQRWMFEKSKFKLRNV